MHSSVFSSFLLVLLQAPASQALLKIVNLKTEKLPVPAGDPRWLQRKTFSIADSYFPTTSFVSCTTWYEVNNFTIGVPTAPIACNPSTFSFTLIRDDPAQQRLLVTLNHSFEAYPIDPQGAISANTTVVYSWAKYYDYQFGETPGTDITFISESQGTAPQGTVGSAPQSSTCGFQKNTFDPEVSNATDYWLRNVTVYEGEDMKSPTYMVSLFPADFWPHVPPASSLDDGSAKCYPHIVTARVSPRAQITPAPSGFETVKLRARDEDPRLTALDNAVSKIAAKHPARALDADAKASKLADRITNFAAKHPARDVDDAKLSALDNVASKITAKHPARTLDADAKAAALDSRIAAYTAKHPARALDEDTKASALDNVASKIIAKHPARTLDADAKAAALDSRIAAYTAKHPARALDADAKASMLGNRIANFTAKHPARDVEFEEDEPALIARQVEAVQTDTPSAEFDNGVEDQLDERNLARRTKNMRRHRLQPALAIKVRHPEPTSPPELVDRDIEGQIERRRRKTVIQSSSSSSSSSSSQIVERRSEATSPPELDDEEYDDDEEEVDEHPVYQRSPKRHRHRKSKKQAMKARQVDDASPIEPAKREALAEAGPEVTPAPELGLSEEELEELYKREESAYAKRALSPTSSIWNGFGAPVDWTGSWKGGHARREVIVEAAPTPLDLPTPTVVARDAEVEPEELSKRTEVAYAKTAAPWNGFGVPVDWTGPWNGGKTKRSVIVEAAPTPLDIPTPTVVARDAEPETEPQELNKRQEIPYGATVGTVAPPPPPAPAQTTTGLNVFGDTGGFSHSWNGRANREAMAEPEDDSALDLSEEELEELSRRDQELHPQPPPSPTPVPGGDPGPWNGFGVAPGYTGSWNPSINKLPAKREVEAEPESPTAPDLDRRQEVVYSSPSPSPTPWEVAEAAHWDGEWAPPAGDPWFAPPPANAR